MRFKHFMFAVFHNLARIRSFGFFVQYAFESIYRLRFPVVLFFFFVAVCFAWVRVASAVVIVGSRVLKVT